MIIPQQILSPFLSLTSCLLGATCWNRDDTTKAVISSPSTDAANLLDLELMTPPDHPRPYFIRSSSPAHSVVTGNQVFRFPVTGNSSGGEFTLVGTNAPPSKHLVVHPHLHKRHYESFLTVKGRIHLWTQGEGEGEGEQQARALTQHDFGSCPPNTTHTLQVVDHDTELLGAVFPGGFERLFYFIGDGYDSPNFAPYDPALGEGSNRGINDTVLEGLRAFDVWARPGFVPRRDLFDGSKQPFLPLYDCPVGVSRNAPACITLGDIEQLANTYSSGRPAGEVWHDGFNGVGNDSAAGYFVANGWGPKYLDRAAAGFYQVVQPLVTPAASGGFNFTESLISINGGLGLGQPGGDASYEFGFGNSFTVLEGRLGISVEGYRPAELYTGDTVYVPGGSRFSYHSNAHFTKVVYVAASHEGVDTILIRSGEYVGSPMFPADQA